MDLVAKKKAQRDFLSVFQCEAEEQNEQDNANDAG
jgi:hypothetical protein